MYPLRSGNSTVPLQVCSTDGLLKAAFTAEVVETNENAALGLSGIHRLPADYGMLFKRAESFWMKDTKVDLDIVYLDKAGTVLELQQMFCPRSSSEDLPHYRPSVKSASLAIEFPFGWCAANDIQPNDTITTQEHGT